MLTSFKTRSNTQIHKQKQFNFLIYGNFNGFSRLAKWLFFMQIRLIQKPDFDSRLKQTRTAQSKNVKLPLKQVHLELQFEHSLIKIGRELKKLGFKSFFRVENVEKLHFGFRVLNVFEVTGFSDHDRLFV